MCEGIVREPDDVHMFNSEHMGDERFTYITYRNEYSSAGVASMQAEHSN